LLAYLLTPRLSVARRANVEQLASPHSRDRTWAYGGSEMTRRAVGVLVLVGGLGVIAVGVAAAYDPNAPPSRRTPHASPTRLSCGGPWFRPSALKRPRGYERRGTPAARALRKFLKAHADEVGQPRRGWFLVSQRRKVVVFLAGRPHEYGAMTFERRRGRWTWAGSGGCTPRAYRDGLVASEWDWNPEGGRPQPTATRIPVLVHPDDCASGRDATGRVLPPYVHYGARWVGVSYYVRPPKGFQTCEGTPPTRMTLVLDQPLGTRKLRDLGAYPPAERRGQLQDLD